MTKEAIDKLYTDIWFLLKDESQDTKARVMKMLGYRLPAQTKDDWYATKGLLKPNAYSPHPDQTDKREDIDPQAVLVGWLLEHGWIPPEEARITQPDNEIVAVQEHDEAMFRQGFEFAQTTVPELRLLSDEEKFQCSLVGRYPYEEVKDIIDEACEHQLAKDKEGE